MASFSGGEKHGALNGTTPVTVCSAPGASTRRYVRSVAVRNRDSAAVTLTLTFEDGVGSTELDKVTLAAGARYVYAETVCLDGTGDSLAIALAGAVATQQPHYLTTYGDES